MEQQIPPPAYGSPYSPRVGFGSVGPVIAVLAVISVMGIISVVVGMLCSGRTVFGYGYDFEGWVERRFAPCIHGGIEPRPPRPRSNAGGEVAAPPAAPTERSPEVPPEMAGS